MRRVRNPPFALPTALTVTTGTLAAGVVSDLEETGGTAVQVTEVGGAPGFDVEVAFAGVYRPVDVLVKAWYDGNAAHEVRAAIYDYTATAWDTFATVEHDARGLWHWYNCTIRDTDHVSSGEAKIRFYHYSSGTPGHDLYIDFARLLCRYDSA